MAQKREKVAVEWRTRKVPGKFLETYELPGKFLETSDKLPGAKRAGDTQSETEKPLMHFFHIE